MEKVKIAVGELQLSGEIREVCSYEWRFTDEEKKELQYTLENYASEEKIRAFVNQIEFVCAEKIALLEQPKKVDAREERERILVECEASLKDLKKIGLGRIDLVPDDSIDYFDRESFNDDIVEQLFFAAREAVGPLEIFVKVLEGYQLSEVKRGGRPPAGSDHFVRRVIDLYIEHIGKKPKPTAYEDGLFCTIVKQIYEALNMPHEDPSRQIKAALKEI